MSMDISLIDSFIALISKSMPRRSWTSAGSLDALAAAAAPLPLRMEGGKEGGEKKRGLEQR